MRLSSTGLCPQGAGANYYSFQLCEAHRLAEPDGDVKHLYLQTELLLVPLLAASWTTGPGASATRRTMGPGVQRTAEACVDRERAAAAAE